VPPSPILPPRTLRTGDGRGALSERHHDRGANPSVPCTAMEPSDN